MENSQLKKEMVQPIIYQDENQDYVIGKLVFYREEAVLRTGEKRIGLQSLPARLLLILLEARHHCLSCDRLMNSLWPDKPGRPVGKEQKRARLSTAVARLNEALRADPSVRVVCANNRAYELAVMPGKTDSPEAPSEKP